MTNNKDDTQLIALEILEIVKDLYKKVWEDFDYTEEGVAKLAYSKVLTKIKQEYLLKE